MVRRYTASSNMYHSLGSAVLTVSPVTFACWFWAVGNGNYNYMVIGDAAGANYFSCGSDGAGHIRAECGGAAGVNSAVSYAAKMWQHAAFTFTGNSGGVTQSVFLNGANKATSAPGGTTTGLSQTFIGGFFVSPTVFGPMDGFLAHVAIWNIALSDRDILRLYRHRLDPRKVHPEALVAYWPLSSKSMGKEFDTQPRHPYSQVMTPTAAPSPIGGMSLSSFPVGRGGILASGPTLPLSPGKRVLQAVQRTSNW